MARLPRTASRLALPPTTIIAALHPGAIRHARYILFTLPFIAGLSLGAVPTGATTTVIAAIDAGAVRLASLQDAASVLAGESSLTLTAGASTSIDTTFLAFAIRRARASLAVLALAPSRPIVLADLNAGRIRAAHALGGLAGFADEFVVDLIRATSCEQGREQEQS